MDGLNFQGWNLDCNGVKKLLTEEDGALPFRGEWISVEAVYDKVPVHFEVEYVNEWGEKETRETWTLVPAGTTVAQLPDYIEDAFVVIDHNPEAGFSGWELESEWEPTDVVSNGNGF